LSELLAYNFDSAGFKTFLVCSGGKEAMPTISSGHPDLIILDWMLPNLSGVEVCRQIHLHANVKTIPVIC